MVSSPVAEGLVHNIKLSSVGPGQVTSPGSIYEPGNMDLAMKLHYIKVVYYFRKEAFEGMGVLKIKEPLFAWFSAFPVSCGRFRRVESGRPYVKCNDCGVRFIEGTCDKTLDEWLDMKKDADIEKLLFSNQCIGPELQFSPLILLQFTKFKCGGMAVGLSWAHVLGDAFSAAEFMNKLTWIMDGNKPGCATAFSHTYTKSSISNTDVVDSLAIKRVDPVGDNWIHVPDRKMEAFSFQVTPTKMSEFESKLSKHGAAGFAPFEIISALIWQQIAKIRGENSEPKVITVCEEGGKNKISGIFGNSEVVSLVKADSSIAEADLGDLAALVKEGKTEERGRIEEVVEREHGTPDFIVYGANLTFVRLDDAKFYEFEYRGCKPVEVSCRVDGVGEEGTVFVLPMPQDGDKNSGGGRTVMAILPENEIIQLKSELRKEGIVA